MRAFGAAFHRLVIPVLRTRCRSAAFLVSLDFMDLYEAEGLIEREARRLGARHLDQALYYDLLDWIYTELLRDLTEFDAKRAAYGAIVDRVAADIRRLEAQRACRQGAEHG